MHIDIKKLFEPWNSLELAKLLVSLGTPLLLLMFTRVYAENEAYYRRNDEMAERALERINTAYARAKEKFAHADALEKEALDRAIPTRIGLWDRLGPAIANIYTYCNTTSAHSKLTVEDAFTAKETIEQILRSHRPFITEAMQRDTRSFLDAAFLTASGTVSVVRIGTAGTTSGDPSSGQVTEEANTAKLNHAYERLMTTAAGDMGLPLETANR